MHEAGDDADEFVAGLLVAQLGQLGVQVALHAAGGVIGGLSVADQDQAAAHAGLKLLVLTRDLIGQWELVDGIYLTRVDAIGPFARTLRGFDALNLQCRAIMVKAVQAVELALVIALDVDNDIAVVQEYPAVFAVALAALRRRPKLNARTLDDVETECRLTLTWDALPPLPDVRPPDALVLRVSSALAAALERAGPSGMLASDAPLDAGAHRAFVVEGGRHPVVERALKRKGEAFVANDCR